MPNWCYTNYTINCPDERAAVNLHDHIYKAISKEIVKSDFGNSWLGNICEYCGVPWGKVECRGSVCDLDVNGYVVSVSTETAWTPKFDPICLIVSKYAPGSEIIYEAEEFGCDLLWTNDPALVGNYLIDCFDLDYCPEKYKDVLEGFNDFTPEGFLEFGEAVYGEKFTSTKELCERFWDEDWLSVHEYEYVEIDTPFDYSEEETILTAEEDTVLIPMDIGMILGVC